MPLIVGLTSFWTIQTLSFLISYTIPKMSTESYLLIRCRILSKAMKVPERPTPAEQCTIIGLLLSGEHRSLKALTNLTKVFGGSGTPKSGQVVK